MIPNLTRMVMEVPVFVNPIPPGWTDKGIFVCGGRPIASCFQHKSLGLAVLLSLSKMEDGSLFEHCSLSRRSRIPSWEDVKIVKNVFLGEDSEAFHILPKKEDYINLNPYCLHLWKPITEKTNNE